MGVQFSSLWFVVPLLVLLLVIAVVVAFTRRSLANGATVLTPRRLVEGYVFTVVLVAMLLVSSGLSDMLRAGIARYTGLQVSYRPTPVYEESRKSSEEPKYEYDEKAPKRDLLTGTAQLGVGLIIGLLHLFGLRRLERTEPFITSPVYRVFLIVGLIIYTSAVLFFAVASVKDWLVYRYVELPPMRSWYERPVPGEQIAGLIGYLPMWGLLVSRLFRYARTKPTVS